MGSFRLYNEQTGTFEKLIYTTIAREGDLKVVTLNASESQIKPIELANSANSIYAVRNDKGKITSINFFGADKHKTKQSKLIYSTSTRGLLLIRMNSMAKNTILPLQGHALWKNWLLLLKQRSLHNDIIHFC